MMLRFQLLVGEGSIDPVRMATRRSDAVRCCSCVGEPGESALPASGNAWDRDGRASCPCVAARGHDVVEVKVPRSAACSTGPFNRSSPLLLFGIATAACTSWS